MPDRRPRVAAALVAVTLLAAGLASTLRDGTLDLPRGADAAAYVRIARAFLATDGMEFLSSTPADLGAEERTPDAYRSAWSLTAGGRLFPKHPVLFGAILAPGVALAGVAGARVTAILLGALLSGMATLAAARSTGSFAAAAASLAIFLFSPAGRNVLWAVNVDTLITLFWFASILLAGSGRPIPAGVVGGLVLFLRPPAAILLAGPGIVLASRPPRERRRAIAGLLAVAAAWLALNTALWGAPWRSSYDRVVVVSGDEVTLASVADRFALPRREGLHYLLLHPAGGLLATAPVCLLGLLGLLLPAGRSRLAVGAVLPAVAWTFFLASYEFLARVPETAYRFLLPLLAASVVPLAALFRAVRTPRGGEARTEGACAVCSGPLVPAWTLADTGFARCRDCGFVRGVPLRTTTEVYGNDYSGRRGHGVVAAIDEAKRRTTALYVTPPAAAEPRPRLLDVGCSAGASLEASEALGYRAFGLEPLLESAASGRKRPGARIVVGTLERAPFRDSSFDIVTAFDVMEHVPDPRAGLGAVRRVLRPGGEFVAVTPDAGSLSLRLLGRRWPHLFAEHVSLFTREAFRRAAGREGLPVVRVRWAPKRVAVETLVRHAAIHGSGSVPRLLSRLADALPARVRSVVVRFNFGEFAAFAVREPEGER